MSRRLEIKNLDSAHEVGPTGSASAQIFVQAGKLMAQLQGSAAVELADLESTGAPASAPTGTIVTYASGTIPSSWLECNGAEVSQSTYADLFALIANTYGSAASGNFRLPDLRGRVVIGTGTGPGLTARTLAATGGAEDVALSGTQIPSHSHVVNDSGHTHGVGDSGHTHNVSDSGHDHDIGHGHTLTNGEHDHDISVATTTTDLPSGFSDTVVTSVGSGPGSSTGSETLSVDNLSFTNSGVRVTGVSVNSGTTGVSVNSGTTGISVTGGGGTDAHDNMAPFLALTCIIKT